MRSFKLLLMELNGNLDPVKKVKFFSSQAKLDFVVLT